MYAQNWDCWIIWQWHFIYSIKPTTEKKKKRCNDKHKFQDFPYHGLIRRKQLGHFKGIGLVVQCWFSAMSFIIMFDDQHMV